MLYTVHLCVFKSSSVSFNCTYDYPAGFRVKTLQWSKPGPQPGQPIIVFHTQPDEIHASYRGRAQITRENKNCTLSLTNVSSSDVGTYFFRFTTFSAAWSGAGGTSLNVAVLPFRVSVNSSREGGFIQEGDAVNLTCAAQNCTPPGVHVTWYKNRVPISQVKSKTLSLVSVSLSDFGNYTCGLNYSDTSTAPEILLNVRYGPKNVTLAVHPTSTIQSGRSLTLICHGYANPQVEIYTMYKVNETDLLRIGWGYNHTIPVVSPRDSGQYICLAENAVGSQNSTVISVRYFIQSWIWYGWYEVRGFNCINLLKTKKLHFTKDSGGNCKTILYDISQYLCY
uniref:Cd22 molecule n=1 Tax=Astyanax mexicanus TaxID=7994 RepID=A0A8B9JC78_ASTMX